MYGYFRGLKTIDMKKLFGFSLFVILSGLITSCYKDNLTELSPAAGLVDKSGNTTCDTAGIMLYSANVVPVLTTYCGTNNLCHGPHNGSGFDLSAYAGVKAVIKSGQMMSAISWSGSATRMPLGGSKIPACSITKIRKWIDAGTINN